MLIKALNLQMDYWQLSARFPAAGCIPPFNYDSLALDALLVSGFLFRAYAWLDSMSASEAVRRISGNKIKTRILRVPSS